MPISPTKSRIAKYSIATAKWLALTFFCVSFIIWVASPFIIRHYLSGFLDTHKITLDGRSHLRYNPLLSSLRIDDLKFKTSDKTVFSLEHAILEIHLHRLLRDRLYIRTLEFKGLEIDIEILNNETRIAGIPLPQSPKNEETPTKQEQTEITIQAPFVLLSDSRINVNNQGIEHHLDLFNIEAREVQITNNIPSLKLKANVGVLNGKTNIEAEVKPDQKTTVLSSRISMQSIQLESILPYVKNEISALRGELNFNIDFKASAKNNIHALAIKNSKIEISNLAASTNNIDLELAAITLGLNNYEASLVENNILANGISALSIKDLSVDDKKQQNRFLALGDLDVSPVNIALEGNTLNDLEIQTDTITLSNIIASHVQVDENTPPLAKLESIHLKALNFKKSNLTLDKVILSDFSSHPWIDTSGEVSTLTQIPEPKGNSTEEKSNIDKFTPPTTRNSDEVISSEALPIQFKINNFSLSGENSIYFKDESVSPTYERTIALETFEFNQIDSASNVLSPFTIKGRSNEYAKFEISGGVAAFTEKTNLELIGSINEVSLPAVSSYIKDSLGFELKSGQLDSTLNVKIKESQLDGKVALHMRGVDMTAANDDAVGSMKDQGAIPLNVALGMLKDKHGNIKLDIPMGGSVDDPAFGVQSFFMLIAKKAAISQAKSYLMNTFVPYASVVSVAISAGEFALKVRFEDLNYAPKSVNIINDTQNKYITEFIKLMKDKPKLQVKICGIATKEDVESEEPLKDISKEKTDEKIRASLKALAKERAENFKRYVTSTSEVDSSRLLLCSPEIDFSENAQPRIKISL